LKVRAQLTISPKTAFSLVGADGTATGNIVTGNSYTGPGQAASGGILVFGGVPYGGDITSNIEIKNNIVIENDVGIYLSNVDSCTSTTCTATATKTNIKVENNTIANASLNNNTGSGPTQGYQAGVSDQGNGDKITNNNISGAGYDPANSTDNIAVFSVDVSSTNHAKVHGNK
jgi:parallel beta-helix repeat protein